MQKVVTLIFITLMSMGLYAQSDKPVRLGLIGTGGVSWLKQNMSDEYRLKGGTGLSWAGGLAVDFRLFGSSNYALSTGLNVLQFRGKMTFPDKILPQGSSDSLLTINTSKYRTDYIDIPLTIKLKTREIGYITYYGQIGSSVGFRYRAKGEANNQYINSTDNLQSPIANVAEETSSIRIPLILGFGGEYNVSGDTYLVLGVQFNNGFTNYFSWNSGKNPNVWELDENGNAKTKLDGTTNSDPTNPNNRTKAVKRSAISNLIGVNIGVYF